MREGGGMMGHENVINENDVCVVLEYFDDGWREVIGVFRRYEDAKEAMKKRQLSGSNCEMFVTRLQ